MHAVWHATFTQRCCDRPGSLAELQAALNDEELEAKPDFRGGAQIVEVRMMLPRCAAPSKLDHRSHSMEMWLTWRRLWPWWLTRPRCCTGDCGGVWFGRPDDGANNER
jgi:hypothetical protein